MADPEPADLPDTEAPPEGEAPVLSAHRLGAQRGGRPLFRQLELAIAPGEAIWLRGRNGCGKTSLLRLMAGLSSPAEGEVRLQGRALRARSHHWRSRVLYLGHANALKDDLTATEALAYLGALRGVAPVPGQWQRALQRIGLPATHAGAAVRTLSQGQRRRVALARLALPAPPGAWLLDEPFDALDADGIAALHGLLAEHCARGGSVLLTSHQPPGLARPALRVLNLDEHAAAP